MYLYRNFSKKSLFIALLLICIAFSFFMAVTVPLFSFAEETVAVHLGLSEEKDPIFILDAGHGGEDCGTIGANGVYEKDLNMEITRALGEYLADMGFSVVYTRTKDALLYTEEENIKGMRKIYDLKNRAEVANAYPDAIFISIHMNAFSDPAYSGLQVFYGIQNETSAAMASRIQASVVRDLQPQNHRKIRSGEGLYLLEKLSCPAVLIECGFLSNPQECEKLCQKEYQKQLCFAIVCGIMEINNEG